MTKRIMREFRMSEISGVDRPAQKPAKVAIMKREDALTKDMYGVSNFAYILSSIGYLMRSAENEAEMEADHSPVPASLRAWLKSGATIFQSMAAEELSEMIGKAEVAKRTFSAKEREADAKSGAAEGDGSFPIENATDLKNAMRAIGRSKNPEKTRAHIRARAKALGLTSELSDAFKNEGGGLMKFLGFFKNFGKSTDRLAESLKTIVADENAVNKGDLVEETIKQFSEHVEGELEKTLSGGLPGDTSEDDDMSLALKKALGLADTASESDVLAAIAKRDEDHKAAVEAAAKAASDAVVAKAVADLEDLKKRNSVLEHERELAIFAKRATDIGVPASKAEVLMKAKKGDDAAIEELFSMLKSATAALDGSVVFKEFGSSHSEAGDAIDAIKAKAAELRKSNPNLTEDQAFAKAYTDPANRKLAAEERRANRPAA